MPRFLHRLLRRPQPATNHEIAAWLWAIRDELGCTTSDDGGQW